MARALDGRQNLRIEPMTSRTSGRHSATKALGENGHLTRSFILAVCRMPVIYELRNRNSVDRVPTRCSRGHGLESCLGLRIFLCHVDDN